MIWRYQMTTDVFRVIITVQSFPHSWLITGFVTRVTLRTSLVEQKLLTLPKHLSSPPVFSGIRVTRSLVLSVMFCRSLFVLFLLAIVLSVFLLFTDSDYPFGIFKLFLNLIILFAERMIDFTILRIFKNKNSDHPIRKLS